MNGHEQFCPIYNGRECDCNYREPVASAGNALSDNAAREAFESSKNGSFYQREDGGAGRYTMMTIEDDWAEFERGWNAALASQSTPVAPAPDASEGPEEKNARAIEFLTAERDALANVVSELREALRDLAEAGEEAWGAERPCVREALRVLSAPKAAAAPVAPVVEQARDNCEICKGSRGGVPGNENRIDGVCICDYCHSDRMRFAALAQSTPHAPAGEPSVPVNEGTDYSLLTDLASIDCHDVNLRDHPEAYEALERYRAILALATPRAPEPAAPVADEQVEYELDRAFKAGMEYQAKLAAPTAAQGQAVDKDSLTAEAAPAGEVASKLQSTAPKRIYLDIGDQFALERVLEGGLSWQSLEGVTWSEDNATSHGVAYVREDLATPATEPAAPGYVSEVVEGLRGSIAVGRDGEWVSIRRYVRDAAILALAAASTVQGKEKP